MEALINNREIPFSFSSEGIPILESTDIPEILESYLQHRVSAISDDEMKVAGGNFLMLDKTNTPRVAYYWQGFKDFKSKILKQ